MDKIKKVICKKNNIIFTIIILLAILSRCYEFLKVPNGIHQDEAYALYESWSLLNFGTDSWGYSYPVYFVSWGSGMNVLLSYITIPFVKIFGLKLLSIRLPMLLFSILCLVFVYLLGKEVKGEKFALLTLIVVAFSPWHFMASRWSIESNLAPVFLIISLYFLMKGFKNSKFYIISSILFGLTLYSYATIWILVPLCLICIFIYLLYNKKIVFDKRIITSIVILFLIALPLLLFLLVNNDLIREVKMPWISIPKLLVGRENEISIASLFNGAKQLIKLLIFQVDDRLIDSTTHFGLYYHFSIIFIVIGFMSFIRSLVLSIKNKAFSNEAVFCIFILSCLFNACLISVIVIVRVNFIHIPLLFCCANGIYYIYGKIVNINRKKLFLYLLSSIYTVLFILFQVEYYTETAKSLERKFNYGAMEAIQFANNLDVERVHIDPELVGKYSILLCALKVTPEEFINDSKYFNYPAPYLYMESMGKYQFYKIDYEYLDSDGAYVLSEGENEFRNRGYNIKAFGNYFVAWRNEGL